MLSLIYASSAVREMDDAELVELLRVARANNTRDGLSGMLLYQGGNFIQVLEGPEDVLLRRFQIISSDPRHVGVVELIRKPITARQFADWSMGFQNVDSFDTARLDGFSDFLSQPMTAERFRGRGDLASRMLLNFRDIMR